MRVLMTSFALNAHFYGSVPLAWALRAAGHEVRFASQPALTASITGAGLTAVPVGRNHTADDVMADVGAEIFSRYRYLDFSGGDPAMLEPEFLQGINTVLTSTFYMGANDDEMVDDLVAFARDWQPDLIIWEPFTFAGAVAARVTGAAHARLLWGPDLFLQMRQAFHGAMQSRPAELRDDSLAEWLTWTLGRYGHAFDEEMIVGQATIDQMPASIRPELSTRSVPMQYVPYNGPAVVPAWLREPPQRPRVCLTLGISVRDIAFIGDVVSLDELFEAVGDLDIEVVATLDEAQRAMVRHVPANTHVVEYVPFHALMPTCSAVVHHGGAGTWSTAAAHGVPQLMLAWMWDNVYRAKRTEELGAGLYLPPEKLSAASLRDGLVRLLSEPSFNANAELLRAEIQAGPTPASVVSTLEELAAAHQSCRPALVEVGPAAQRAL